MLLTKALHVYLFTPTCHKLNEVCISTTSRPILSCARKPQMMAICTYMECTKATTCYDSKLKGLSDELTLVLSDTRELDRVPSTE